MTACIGDQPLGLNQPLALVAGPCVIESSEMVMEIAEQLVAMTQTRGIPFIFKASFDKANRSSVAGYRGCGLEAGLAALALIRQRFKVPVITDVHEYTPLAEVASVVDWLQTPAFLCRQTDFIQAVASQGLPVNIKKGQFLAPWDMQHVVAKAQATGNQQITVCERGVSFGYNNLVADMRSLAVMRQIGVPVLFDATHSVQLPGGQGIASGGQREHVPLLARAAVAAGVSGLFIETHPTPDQALSDGPNMWPLARLPALLDTLIELHAVVQRHGLAETTTV